MRAREREHLRLRRGELARLAGCHPETIRFWEQEGLLPAPPRTASGHRVYGAEHLRRLRFLVRARALGFTLDEIRGLLALVDAKDWSCAAVRERTRAHLADVERRLADLARMRDTLADLVARCRGDETPDCAVIETLFEGGDERERS